MQAKEAAERLRITQRMLRHYEKQGLMTVGRTLNGYRHYREADLRRAGRIRDFIATGFSTREIRAMSACLSDEGSGPCEGGIEKLTEKLAHIERLRTDLDERRDALLDRLASLRGGLSSADRPSQPLDTPVASSVRHQPRAV
ncbi:MerR family transcriptional regulator [uncultured Sulfitobacter sp.]|uniref:MerR family transcriptional regulator n=1 Tax=uncultured Sulfitobacter sp. TaxID=191468 RepID=UPI0034577306